jgi:hypothetical protein
MKYNLLKSENFLTNYIKYNKEVLLFQLKLAEKAIKSSRKDLIYNPPFPELDETIIEKCFKKNILDNTENCKSDEELPFDDRLYKFIVFSIYATPIIFRKCNIIKDIDDLEQFEVKNTYEQEQHLNKHGNNRCYLFHGSRMENWYSIIKNGIKICSGTPLQLNGKVYGDGIYLSDKVEFATTYCDCGIVGVFEIIGDKNMYKKTNDIYVVDDITKLVLRYFLCFDSKNKIKLVSKINECFNKNIHVKKQEIKKKNNSCCEARMYKELDIIGDKYQLVDNNIFIWKILSKQTDFDKDSKLRKDMIEYNISHVEFEARIPEKYPFEPPFIRVVKPVFKYKTGHITVGGSICVDILTAVAWSPACTIKSTISTIESLIIDAEIDNQSKKTEYSYDEAIQSFNRVAKDHGWLR